MTAATAERNSGMAAATGMVKRARNLPITTIAADIPGCPAVPERVDLRSVLGKFGGRRKSVGIAFLDTGPAASRCVWGVKCEAGSVKLEV